MHKPFDAKIEAEINQIRDVLLDVAKRLSAIRSGLVTSRAATVVDDVLVRAQVRCEQMDSILFGVVSQSPTDWREINENEERATKFARSLRV